MTPPAPARSPRLDEALRAEGAQQAGHDHAREGAREAPECEVDLAEAGVTKIVQSWPKLRDLAQHFD